MQFSRSTPLPGHPRGAAALAAVLVAALVATSACGGAAKPGQASGASGASGAKVALKIAEPVHGVGYLPLYVGISKGFFAAEGLDVSTVTLQGGSAHTNAVLNGDAWGFIGGPEHNAFAKAKGASVKAIANIVNRGNVYLVAPPSVKYTGDLASFLTGKTIVTSAFGGTPNSITRYLLDKHGLKTPDDVKLIETGDAASMLTVVKSGNAQIAVTSEPILGKGVKEGIWAEPFYNIPKELGPYAFSTLNVKADSIKADPTSVAKFTRAMVKSLELVKNDHAGAFEVARKEFPTFDPVVLQATIDRSYADELWEFTGQVSPESIDTALNVVRASGVLKDKEKPVKYDEIVDMAFINKAGSS
jgi:NitT/TauT family transport system substrate-binding protein